MSLRFGLAGLFVAGLATFVMIALAEPQQQSLRQALADSAGKNGERLVGEAQGGDLDDADEVVLTFTVDPSKAYKLYGACDSDCTKLSVTAEDADGDTIDWSGSDDANPVLKIDDFSGSTISVEVFMTDCKADPCAFAVSLAETGARRTISSAVAVAEILSGVAFDSGKIPAASEEELVSALKERTFDSWKLVNEVGVARLKTGEAYRYFHEVDPDGVYEGLAVCDCADLDLVFRDDDDHALTSDLASGNRPGVEIFSGKWPKERRSGKQRLILEVRMTGCGRDSCTFAAGVYRAN
jgi:hypothetical protein